MSDPSRLNLIQRAMQRGALTREAARPNALAREGGRTDTLPHDAGSVPGEAARPDSPARAATAFARDRVTEALASETVRQDKPAGSEHVAVQRVETPPASRAPDQIPATAAPSIRAEIIEPLQLRRALPVRLDAEKLSASRISSPENTHSVTYNEFRSLKRKLIPMTANPETGAMTRNMVMVTSALPGEGKTFTAMNLAIALAAEPNLDVILVDADVVQSSIASFFQAADPDGLLELLTGKRKNLDEVLHPCLDLPRLHVLFAGARHDYTPELLASRGMAELCADLAKRFPQSIVLFDTPPVLATSEAVAMAAHVHHLLMVVAAGRSGRDQVKAALDEVSRCPSMSIVFNQSPEWERPLNDMYSRPYSYGAPKPEEASV